MKYLFYLKSHSAMPDIEEEIEAKNIVEAVKFLCQRISPYYNDYPVEELFRNISCLEKEKPKPFEDKLIEELLAEIKKQEEEKWEMEKDKDNKKHLVLRPQQFLAEKGLLEELIDYLAKEKEKSL